MHDHFIETKLAAVEQSTTVLAKNAQYSKAVLEYQSGTDLQLHVEHLYKQSLYVLDDVQRLLQALHDESVWAPGEKLSGSNGVVVAASPFAINVVYETVPPCVHVTLDSPPVLKSRASAYPYGEAVQYPLQEQTIRALPRGFRKWASVCVIYVNHTDATHGRAPYYDNDNVAVKEILDAVVPYVCVDDAAIFTDNFFIYQEDVSTFTELFIVPKTHFHDWIATHQNLDFCRNLTGKFT